MILKIVLGKGGRGLLSYISQIQKAPIHHPQNEPEIYGRLHIPDPDFHPARRGQPTAGINQLQKLSIFHVVLNPGPNADDQRSGKGSGEVFLPGDALHHLGRGPATDADGLRRPGHRPGPTSTEKRGGRKLEKQSAPPTFSNFAGSTPKAIAAEFGALRKLTPNLGKAVAHLILSPGPEDRVLSKDEWKRALDLALAEHGAGDALYAAYLHADTDHPHLHCFFSRITPAGQVISDSLSYQKNRSATKKITQELQLTPLPNTPNPQAPGDRQALQNASRRAERSGTPGPEKINVQAVREALGKAKTEEDYVLLNAEIGNEIVYLRRGEDQEIYGYKMRRIGSSEWIKASTLAKDLSWPRIKHRFAESQVMAPAQEAPTLEAPAPAPPAQAKTETDQYSRAPAPLRQMLREQRQQRQMVPTPKPHPETQTTTKSWDIDLAEVDRATRDLGVLSRAMALLGSAALKISLSFLNQIIGWIKRLLQKVFGIGFHETLPASGSQAVAYEPYVIEGETREVPNADAAAQLVNQVTAAIEAKDAALLPDVEGRDAIAAMLTDGVGEHDPLARLQAAASAYLRAEQAVVLANANPPADLILVQEARKARGVFSEQLGCSQLSFKRELSHIDDPVFKVQLEAKLKKAIKEFAEFPIEGGSNALQECVDQVTEVRRLAVEDQTPFPKAKSGDTADDVLTNSGRQPEPDALDDMFSSEVANAAEPAPMAPLAPPATPPKTALAQFLDAAKAYTLSAESVRVASLKPIMYFDGRPLAQTRHDAAAAELFELEKVVTGWRAEHKVASALGVDPLGLKPRAEAARARAATTQAALLKADREHAEFLVLFDKTPVAVPFALQDRHAAAAAGLKKAQELLISRARLNLTILDGNPMLRQKREQFGSQIRRAETRLAAFLADPRTQPSVVKDVDDMIRALASDVAIERARLMPRPDADDGQNGDEAGQHGQAVPGQR